MSVPTPPALIDPHVFDELQATAGADFVADLVENFADEAPALLVELRAAHADAAAERFRRAAHSLKSNSHAFGAMGLSERARALELGGLPATAAPIEALQPVLTDTIASLRAMART